MLKFSANLSFLYQEFGFLNRFAAAARDGFEAVEYMSPFEEKPEIVAKALRDHGLAQALFNLPAGDWTAGERGIAGLPGRQAEFQDGVRRALDYAAALGCARLNVISGLLPDGVDRSVCEDVLVDNLGPAAELCATAGVRLLIEPINSRDMPGFLVTTTDQAEAILDRVGHPNLFIQYDLYHRQVMQGDLVPGFARLQPRIAHIQLADTPGRHEPGTGEINFGFVLREIDRLGYDGWIGCEYRPLSGTSAGLGWMRDFR